jgi:hypothetical protein
VLSRHRVRRCDPTSFFGVISASMKSSIASKSLGYGTYRQTFRQGHSFNHPYHSTIGNTTSAYSAHAETSSLHYHVEQEARIGD